MPIIGVSGKARSGKNVFAEYLAAELYEKTRQPYVLMAYADVLKNMVQEEFDLSWDQLWGDEKEAEDKRYHKQLKYRGGVRPAVDELPSSYWTGREIMQAFGSFYRSIDPNFWVKKLFRIIEEKEYNSVIITDVRYPNEVDPVLEKGGYHIRVHRDIESKIHGQQHSSETSLDEGYKVDFNVKNNSTLDHLRDVAADIVGAILQMENLLKDRIPEYK